MPPERDRRPRPYWHVDAKWVIGLALWFVLSATLIVGDLVFITEPDPAMNTIGYAMALAFSNQSSSAAAQADELNRILQASPDRSIQPIPGFRVSIRYEEVSNLAPEQIRSYIFRQLAEPTYIGGVQKLGLLVEDRKAQARIQENATIFDFFTLGTHQALQGDLLALAAISLFLFVPLVLFSARFGRIGSPGVLLLAVSVPGVLLSSILAALGERAISASPSGGGDLSLLSNYLASAILPQLANTALQSYLAVSAAGLGLVFVAVVGNFVWWLYVRRHPESANM